jgi:ankyrin repeat protein
MMKVKRTVGWLILALGLVSVLPVLVYMGKSPHTPMYKALRAGDDEAVARLIAGNPSVLECRIFNPFGEPDFWNDPPLCVAAYFGNTNITSQLLAAGQPIDVRGDDQESETPLWQAVRGEQPAMTVFLLGRGADVNAKGGRGHFAPLHLAAVSGDTNLIEIILQHGATVDIRNDHGQTPLIVAAGRGQADAVSLLLDHGADIQATSKTYGRTALHEAAEFEQVEAARVLLQRGIKVDLDALIERKKADLAGVPLATKETKDEFRELIRILEERKMETAQQAESTVPVKAAPSASSTVR